MRPMQMCVHPLTFAAAMQLHFRRAWGDVWLVGHPERPPEKSTLRGASFCNQRRPFVIWKMSSDETKYCWRALGCIFFSCRGNSASATVQRLDQTYRCVATLTRTYQNQLMYQGFFSHSSNDQGCILELRPWPRLATSSRLVCFPLGPCHKQHKICLALPVLSAFVFHWCFRKCRCTQGKLRICLPDRKVLVPANWISAMALSTQALSLVD